MINGKENGKGILWVVSGPSGVGKDEVLKLVEKNHPEMKRVVTWTNRPKRNGEIEGVDYHFTGTAEFEASIRAREFLEYVVYRRNEQGEIEYKGTKKDMLTKVISGCGDMAWRIDPSRTATVTDLFRDKTPELYEEIMKRLIVTYIGVEDLVTLFRRRYRRDCDAVSRQKMIEGIQKDWQVWNENEAVFRRGNVVINYEGRLKDTVSEVEKIIAERKAALS